MDIPALLSPDRLAMLQGLGDHAIEFVVFSTVPLGIWIAVSAIRRRKILPAIFGCLLATGVPVLGLVGWILQSGAFGCAYF